MFRSTLLCGFLTLVATSSVFAQSNRSSATSSSAVNSSRTTSSSASRSAAANTGNLGEFQPIDRGGFVGRSQETGFVGRGTSTGTGMTGMGRSGLGTGLGMGMGMNMGMGMGGMGMGGMGMGGMGGRGLNSQFGQQNSGQNQRANIRATVKVRFPYTRPPVARVNQTVMARWNRIPLPEKFNGVSLNFEDGVATLTGQVATPEDKRMAEKLILLEPGVSSVQNQLEVVAAEDSK
jgi:hypothetical protein